ncbi:MAG: biopolymer transporter ExbD [Bdellovibrionota bacterium]
MLKRPSSRRRSRGTSEIDLPLVPIMDAFVTLIAFLLLATSLLAVTLIDTPVPVVSTMPEEKNKEKPLALTLTIEQDKLELSSGSRQIKTQVFPKIDKDYALDKLHEALVPIKQQFLKEQNIVFMPVGDVKYDDLVHLMDTVRLLLKTDPPIYTKDAAGVDKPETYLFANVIFGNVISGN